MVAVFPVVGGLGVLMPRIEAYKDLKWTGKVVWVGKYDKDGMLGGPQCLVRLDGVIFGPKLTGRVLDDQHRPTRQRYHFYGPDGEPGLPDWCRIVRLCKKCNHFACPFCQTWCDSIIGVDGDMCCDGECAYDEPDPYQELDVEDFADDFRDALVAMEHESIMAGQGLIENSRNLGKVRD